MSFAKPTTLSREQVAEFEREVNTIRDSVMNNLGQAGVMVDRVLAARRL